MVRAFDLIKKLRYRPNYQLLCGAKLAYDLLLGLVCLIFLSSSTTLVMRSRAEPLSTTVNMVTALML